MLFLWKKVLIDLMLVRIFCSNGRDSVLLEVRVKYFNFCILVILIVIVILDVLLLVMIFILFFMFLFSI